MRYIDTFREGMHIADVYLCKNKQIALTKNGKEYGNLVMQDKTGTIDAKIWDLGSPGFTWGLMTGKKIEDCLGEGAILSAQIVQKFNPY